MASEQSGKTPPAWRIFALALLFWLPVISGLVSRAVKHSVWFRDYGAIACGAEKWLQGLPIYDRQLECAGVPALPFVYHPAVAQLFAQPLAQFGQQGVLTGYAIVFTLALLLLTWIVVGRKAPTSRARRAWTGAFITGSTVYWGNIAIILHAMIAAAAILLRRWPIVLVVTIALAAVVKPLFLTFAVVFLLSPWPLWRRLAYGVAAIILGGAPTAWFMYSGGELAEQWRALVSYWVYVGKPGDGYLGWLAMFGASGNSLAGTLSYLALAGGATLAALIVAEGLDMADDERAALGLSVAVLLIPRLMSHDIFLLVIGFAAVATAIGAANAKAGAWFGRALLLICAAGLIGNLADLADVSTRLCTMALAVFLFASAIWVLATQRVGVGGIWRSLAHGRTLAAT